MNVGTWLFTLLKGRRVGADAYGNVYYEERAAARRVTALRRWVVYAGAPEASQVPPEWHAWLHYTTDAPLAEQTAPPVGEAASAERHRHAGRLSPARP